MQCHAPQRNDADTYGDWSSGNERTIQEPLQSLGTTTADRPSVPKRIRQYLLADSPPVSLVKLLGEDAASGECTKAPIRTVSVWLQKLLARITSTLGTSLFAM